MKIEIPGQPIPLQRARASRNHFYDPQFKAKQNLAWYVAQKITNMPLFEKGISMNVIFHMEIPKSWSIKKKTLHIGKPHISRPDTSNLIKFIEDALNEKLWKDDCLIHEIYAKKVWALDPKTVLDVKESFDTQGLSNDNFKSEDKK